MRIDLVIVQRIECNGWRTVAHLSHVWDGCSIGVDFFLKYFTFYIEVNQRGIDGIGIDGYRFFEFTDAIGGFVAGFDESFSAGRDRIACPIWGSTATRGMHLLNEQSLIAGIGEGISVRCKFDGFRDFPKIV